MARKIVITSGKGGVGKTTICAYLGYALARNSKRVLLIDVDLGLNNLDILTGIENRINFDIVDVIENRCRIKQALVQDLELPNLYILPSAHTLTQFKITSQNLKKIVDDIDIYFDFILLDCPAGIDEPFLRSVSCCDEAIVVVTPNLSSLRDADKVISILNSKNIENIGIIVNRIRGDMILNNDMIDAKKIESILKTQICGVVPEDDNITTFCGIGKKINKNCESFLAFETLSKNLCEDKKIILDYTQKYKGLLGTIKRFIRKRV